MNENQAMGEGEGLLGKAKEMLGGLTGDYEQAGDQAKEGIETLTGNDR
jgi:uncharacterized protein YjbJ (UPF0337 family)